MGQPKTASVTIGAVRIGYASQAPCSTGIGRRRTVIDAEPRGQRTGAPAVSVTRSRPRFLLVGHGARASTPRRPGTSASDYRRFRIPRAGIVPGLLGRAWALGLGVGDGLHQPVLGWFAADHLAAAGGVVVGEEDVAVTRVEVSANSAAVDGGRTRRRRRQGGRSCRRRRCLNASCSLPRAGWRVVGYG